MYAVVETSGRQYKVEQGVAIEVNQIAGNKGDSVELDKVLLYSDINELLIGKPYLDNVLVKAIIQNHGRTKKIIVYKKKRRKGYHKKQGHRQDITKLLIEDIKKK